MDDRGERGRRILNAAAELLVAWGYRRVSIEEVAKRAGVGKGTVYLHWRSRDELFLATLLRESSELLDDVVRAARADPATILPHRYFRLLFRGMSERPLLRAMFTMDVETLGKLADHRSGKQVSEAKTLVSAEYFGLLVDNGLLRADFTPTQHMYAAASTFLGYLVADPLIPGEFGLDPATRADVFAETIRRTLESETPPDESAVAELAPKIVEKIEELADTYRRYSR